MASELVQSSGKITFLRAHDVGSGWGAVPDFIDVEVVVKLSTQPNRAMGFQLRNDANRLAHQGMLDLLRDAFNHNWTATIEYSIDEDAGRRNGITLRTWLTK